MAHVGQQHQRKYIYIYIYISNRQMPLCILIYVFLLLCLRILIVCLWHSSATLTEVFPCFFLSCKANARVYIAKTGHGPHSSKKFCVVLCIVCFVSFYVLFVCKCVPYYCHQVATQLQFNKYINSYIIDIKCFAMLSINLLKSNHYQIYDQ